MARDRASAARRLDLEETRRPLDPYEPDLDGVFIGGGLSWTPEVTRESPFQYGLAVQRWAALERPGIYELFAVHFANRGEPIGYWQAVQAAVERRLGAHWILAPECRQASDARTGRTARLAVALRHHGSTRLPLVDNMSPELRNKLGARAEKVQDFAHFRIRVREGSSVEIAAMVAGALQLAETAERSAPASRADATREAIWFVRQDCFLPTVAGWMRKDSRSNHYTSLAMNPTVGAQSLLFDELCRGAVDENGYLPSRCTRNAIPVLISRLGDPKPRVRGIADRYLRTWTGLGFSPAGTWRPNLQEDPSREEGRRMQAAWERWWKGNASTFRPTDPWERRRHRTEPGGPLPNPAESR